jgi:hypothetical protein
MTSKKTYYENLAPYHGQLFIHINEYQENE